MARMDPDALARMLRQREEFGATEFIVEGGLARELLESARKLRGSAGAGSMASGSHTIRSRQPASEPVAQSRALPREGVDPEIEVIRSELRAIREEVRGPATVAPETDETDSGQAEMNVEVGYDELRNLAMGCTRCELCEGRTQVVFSDGNPEGRLMVVGEAPGANEDRTGLPFVGAAGKLLDLLLATIDLSRKNSVYICNVIKCRPPENRNPTPKEIAACAPFLKRQIEIVRPEAILAVGSFAAQLLSGKDRPIGELRGSIHEYQGIPLIVTYHPAALLRNPGWTRPTWDDLQMLRGLLDSRVGSARS